MQDRDLIVGVLAAQAGFVTPSEVLTAAAGLADAPSDSLLTRLERSGALDRENRKLIEEFADRALRARNGDARAVANALGGAALLETLVSQLNGAAPAHSPRATGAEIPLERPGQYTRLRELGRGSQSVVRAARDEIVGREVALKELVTLVAPAEDDSSRAARARFLREVRLVAGLDHPGIISILELARREDGTLVCAQKLIRGETLQARLAKCRSLADRLGLLRHVLDACQAVGFAHSKRVIHRDLKPSNIMVGEYGETVVVDWGLAKRREEAEEVVPLVASSPGPGLTVAGEALGTPAYMSPEQARGDLPCIDARSDVFSLGAILYELLTGRPPFVGSTPEHILENASAGKVYPVKTLTSHAPAELAAIAERALQPQPSDRYRDAEELAKDLSTYLSGGRVGAYQYGTWELVRKFAAGHRALTASVAVALGALLISAAAVAVRLQIARRDLARAFIERARIAESQSDWTLAAGYFAAARTQRDTAEARWGVELAADRAPERILSLEGPPHSFTDVGMLADGRLVVLAATPNQVEVRELDGGKVLWHRDVEVLPAEAEGSAAFAQDQVRVTRADGWVYFDAAAGEELAVRDWESMGRPCEGRHSAQLTLRKGVLILSQEGQPGVTLATDVTRYKPRCAVSPDGGWLAYRDTQDRVHLVSLPDGHRLAERPGKGVRNLLFSRHGLILVRQGWIDSMGAPEGDFSVALGEPAFTLDYPPGPGGSGVSPDGELVIVSRLKSSMADVVDLRTRTVRMVLHHGPGWPRFAFSSDGQRILAAGLGRDSHLVAWRLPRDRTPTGHPGHWLAENGDFFPTCCRLAIEEQPSGAIHIHGARGELLGREPLPEGASRASLAEGGAFFYSKTPNDITLRDVDQHRDVWTHPCRGCGSVARLSRNRARAAHTSLEGLEIWEGADRLLFREPSTKGSQVAIALSPDGERTAWATAENVHIRDLSSGQERQLTLEGPPDHLEFSPDSKQLVAVTPESLSLWDAATGHGLWNVSNVVSDRLNGVRWATDGRSLLLNGTGTTLFDAGNGERQARFPAEPGLNTSVRPDLRVMLVVSSTNWDLLPLPQPASDSPEESLERTLRKTGLALKGAEIVAAP